MKFAVTVAMSFVLQCFCVTPGEIARETCKKKTDSELLAHTVGVSGCIASAGKLREEATVTCCIPAKRNLPKSLIVYHYLYSDKVSVIECWLKDGNWTCNDSTDYKSGNLNKDSKESFTLRIVNFSQNHTGYYTCEFDRQKNGNCTVEMRPDDGLTTDQLSIPTARFSTTKDTLITHTSTTTETQSVKAQYTIPVVLTVSLVVVVIVITILLWCCWRRKRQKISRTPGSEDKDSENKDQRDNLINKSKESEDLSSLPPSPSGAFTDWQTSKGQLTFLDEDQKQAQCAEVLSTPKEKRDPQQTPQHSFQNVMELLKNFPQSDSPLKSINKQITKLTYRSGADGSVEIALETNLSCPDKDQEKEDVSLGQHKMQQESPSDEDKEQAGLNACKTCIVEMELKSSIDVQEEQTATDIHRGFVDPDIKVIEHEDSMNLKQSGELKEPATQEDRLVKPSSPPDVVSPDGDLSANTNNFSEKPEETSKLLGKWSTVDQDSQSQTFETQVDPKILLSHLTTTTKLSEDNTEQQESSSVSESASETGLLKVRTVQ